MISTATGRVLSALSQDEGTLYTLDELQQLLPSLGEHTISRSLDTLATAGLLDFQWGRVKINPIRLQYVSVNDIRADTEVSEPKCHSPEIGGLDDGIRF